MSDYPDLIHLTGAGNEYDKGHTGAMLVGGHPRLPIVYYAIRLDKGNQSVSDQQLVIVEEDLRPLDWGGATIWREIRRYRKSKRNVFNYNIGVCGVAVAGKHLVVSLAIGKIESDGWIHAARDIVRDVVPQ